MSDFKECPACGTTEEQYLVIEDNEYKCHNCAAKYDINSTHEERMTFKFKPGDVLNYEALGVLFELTVLGITLDKKYLCLLSDPNGEGDNQTLPFDKYSIETFSKKQ